MWTFTLETGILTDGKRTIHAYSGAPGVWKNSPYRVRDRGLGAIPMGHYTIGPAFKSPHSGEFTMRLTPKAGTNTYGRSEFEIHGDSINHPGAASHGCICTTAPSGRADREYIAASPYKDLEVISTSLAATVPMA